MRKAILLSILISISSVLTAQTENIPIILGGELGNSSATCTDDITRIFPKLERMGLNTVLVPAYWEMTEPQEGVFDFSLTDQVLTQARENHLKVIFLWFGAWKNSMSCYAPLWFKKDFKKYPRSYNAQGKPLEIASPFSENVFRADNRAFTQWMKHIAEADKGHGTVAMIQIENEIGMLESARDHSKEADRLYKSAVPADLISYLNGHKQELHPYLSALWEAGGYKTTGNWENIFGSGICAEEIFMAYHYAHYAGRMAADAKEIYDIPYYVNAAMNSRGRKPGEYPSAGPLAHLIDIWRCGAPEISFIAPDIYDLGFQEWAARYDLPGNPLFIPESRLCENSGVRAFYVFGEHGALGFSPFSIEDGSDAPDASLVKSYRTLAEISPIIAENRGKGTMNGLLFDQENTERIIMRDGMKITCRHYFTLPWDPRATDGSVWNEGGGILIRTAEMEYIVAGSGIVLTFENEGEDEAQTATLGEDGFAQQGGKTSGSRYSGKERIGIGSVEQMSAGEDGTLTAVRRLNGDQTHQGRHVRIPMGDFQILKVKLYKYR